MYNNSTSVKILAVAGTIFIWFPIFFTVFTSVAGTIASRVFRLDYLMPAELFPFAFIGALLLLIAVLLAHSHQKPIGFGLIAMFVFIFGGQFLALACGFASGAAEPSGWPWVFVITSLILYSLAIIWTGIAGISLVIKLFCVND